MDYEIGKEFMIKTRFENLKPSDQMMNVPMPQLESVHKDVLFVKNLPDPSKCDINNKGLFNAINKRRSVREYSNERLSIEELSYLLWCTQGVQKVVPKQATFRTVPSAGARHSIETFLLINNVEGLEPGLYDYMALSHQIAEINAPKNIKLLLTNACLDQDIVFNSAVTFIWTADSSRMTWRYGDRGYRYLFLDAGHVCQNLYLSAEAIDCGVCAIAAFNDEEINYLLKLDGEEQFTLYLASVGKKLD